ncbi:MAG TPA: DUF3209 family protein [Methylomirabilota bacterium]|jgi:hypothetical protein|nr:DUF3209 family protein [Methylomirabilota bacterium]
MACDEIAGLRLALMNLLGGDRQGERQHEEAELGNALRREGPIKSLATARTLTEITQQFEAAIVELEQRQAEMTLQDEKFHYMRTLVVAVKSAELTFRRLQADLEYFYRSLEEVHDLIHEIYPTE